MKDFIINAFRFIEFGFMEPLVRLINGEEPKKNLILTLKKIGLPILTMLLFVFLWEIGAKSLYDTEADRRIEKARSERGDEAAEEIRQCLYPDTEDARLKGSDDCQVATLPAPAQVWDAYKMLKKDWEEIADKKAAFYQKVSKTNAKRVAQGKAEITYTGRPSFIDQIKTSLKTVGMGFLLALCIAVPFGIITGLSETLRSSTNWLIQIFKPVSPVVWLLLVSMIVKTVITDPDLDKAFVTSFISVGLCAMWATLVNTRLGVSSVDPDYMNVASVLKLNVGKKIFKVILPASIPLIFTGLRITVSVSWMVLIAIELLAQSPGLGSFVWEEFQNGATESNAKIIVAMFVIGIIGFLLDLIAIILQKLVSFSKEPVGS